ncbi:MAG: hypothetical protein PUP93_11950 [Rhizonema sp. NSF051]|nr:hypothetical protein [Rhizonema sp. NSF051]
MQPDLIGLEITKGELRRLTGFKPGRVSQSSRMENREQRMKFLRGELLVVFVVTAIIVGVAYAFIILPTMGSSPTVGIILFIVVLVAVVAGRSLWRRLTFPKTLKALLNEAEKYHGVIQQVDIHDQQATEKIIHDREMVVEALQLVREDLVQALKTERILRDNKKSRVNNQDLIANNLTNLQTLQVSDRAGEYAQLLNQALQIAFAVEAQIGKLQSRL